MAGKADERRFYAKGFAVLCIGVWVSLAVTSACAWVRVDDVPRWMDVSMIVFVAVPGLVLIPTAVSLLLAPYAEVRSDRLILRSAGFRRVLPFDAIEEIERSVGPVLQVRCSGDRRDAQLPILVLGASSSEFEAALDEALRRFRSGPQ